MITDIDKFVLMQDIPIHNEELLEILDEVLQFTKTIDFEKSSNVSEKKLAEREEYTSEEYMKSIQRLGSAHDGYPERIVGVGFNADDAKTGDYDNSPTTMRGYMEARDKLQTWAGANRNALFAVYPPGGFISLHNNANCPSYNVLFTWSDTGHGRWKHWDPVKKEIVVIEDKPGWQCKMGYYGSYSESSDFKKVVYHMAETECRRATVAFIFNVDETGKMLAEMLLEEIQTP